MSRQGERRLNQDQQIEIALHLRRLLCAIMEMAEKGLLTTSPTNAAGSSVVDTICNAASETGRPLSQHAAHSTTPDGEINYPFAEEPFIELLAILLRRNVAVQALRLNEITDVEEAAQLDESPRVRVTQHYGPNGLQEATVAQDKGTIFVVNTDNDHFFPRPAEQNSRAAYLKEYTRTFGMNLCFEATIALWLFERDELSELCQLVTAKKLKGIFGANTEHPLVDQALQLQDELTQIIHDAAHDETNRMLCELNWPTVQFKSNLSRGGSWVVVVKDKDSAEAANLFFKTHDIDGHYSVAEEIDRYVVKFDPISGIDTLRNDIKTIYDQTHRHNPSRRKTTHRTSAGDKAFAAEILDDTTVNRAPMSRCEPDAPSNPLFSELQKSMESLFHAVIGPVGENLTPLPTAIEASLKASRQKLKRMMDELTRLASNVDDEGNRPPAEPLSDDSVDGFFEPDAGNHGNSSAAITEPSAAATTTTPPNPGSNEARKDQHLPNLSNLCNPNNPNPGRLVQPLFLPLTTQWGKIQEAVDELNQTLAKQPGERRFRIIVCRDTQTITIPPDCISEAHDYICYYRMPLAKFYLHEKSCTIKHTDTKRSLLGRVCDLRDRAIQFESQRERKERNRPKGRTTGWTSYCQSKAWTPY